MRPRRIHAASLDLGPLHMEAWHRDVGSIRGEVTNLSLQGVCVSIDGRAELGSAILTGDRLRALVISSGETELHRGDAVVRRVADESSAAVLGIELDEPGIDIDRIYRHSTRVTIAQRWREARTQASSPGVSAPFKAWVATLRAYLSGVEEFLIGEERALQWHDSLARRSAVRELIETVAPDVVGELRRARDQLAPLVADLGEEEHARYRAFCQQQLSCFFDQAPFVRRAKKKPLGYAGDYELMNMLYDEQYADDETTLGQSIQLYVIGESAAQANIRRIDYLVGHLRREQQRCAGSRLRVASIGCGPAREIHRLLTIAPELGASLDVALLDQEEQAIAYCERTLTPLVRSTGARIQFIRESIRRLLARDELATHLGARDLIYSAGLFDYLNDRAFAALLRSLYAALAPGGLLLTGNVARHNPSRWMQEYFCNWFLQYRDAEELLRLVPELSPRPLAVRVESEETGVNLFLSTRRREAS